MYYIYCATIFLGTYRIVFLKKHLLLQCIIICSIINTCIIIVSTVVAFLFYYFVLLFLDRLLTDRVFFTISTALLIRGAKFVGPLSCIDLAIFS